MSGGSHFPFRTFFVSVVLISVAAASVYLSYELVVKPRQAMHGFHPSMYPHRS